MKLLLLLFQIRFLEQITKSISFIYNWFSILEYIKELFTIINGNVTHFNVLQLTEND